MLFCKVIFFMPFFNVQKTLKIFFNVQVRDVAVWADLSVLLCLLNRDIGRITKGRCCHWFRYCVYEDNSGCQ